MDFLDDPLGDITPVSCNIDFRKELNDEQYAAVTSPFGPALVLAGAGSGKTRTLTYRVAWLLSQGVDPSSILLLTFTNKASREMLHRVETLTGVRASAFWGGTFHSVGQRLLRLYGQVVGLNRHFNILDVDDAELLLSDSVRSVEPSFLKDKDKPKAKVIAGIISLARNKRIPIFDALREEYPFFDFLAPRIEAIAADYAKRKLEQQVCDYDDLLELWLRMMDENPGIQDVLARRFEHVLVDEYQDTNRLQSEIVDLVGSHHRVMAVGDDAQCIYTWRGADFENIMSFPLRHKGARIYKIETNYRSTPEILELANSIISNEHRPRGYDKQLRPVRPSRSKPVVVAAMDGRQEAQFVAQRIEGIVDSGEGDYGDIAVLYRAHYLAMDIQMELDRRGIPYTITSGMRFFEQAHVKDVAALLRFACNPSDSSAFQRFIRLLPKVGEKTAQRIHEALIEASRKDLGGMEAALEGAKLGIPPAAGDSWKELSRTLLRLLGAAPRVSPGELVEQAVDGWYTEQIRLAYQQNWQERLDDLGMLVEFAGRFDTVPEFLSQLVLLSSETGNKRVETDPNSVRLTTVHQSKGLEYPVVFVIGCGEGQFPGRRSIESGNLEEERRLFYVATTRAMDQLYLSWGMISSLNYGAMQTKASRFLSEMPKHLFELVKWKSRNPGY